MRNTRITMWEEDLDQLYLELPQRHKKLFFQLKRKSFSKQISTLKEEIEENDDYMILVKIAAIVASAGDAHTSVLMSLSRFLPFEFYWFPEGIYIVATIQEHLEYLNCRVTHINKIPIKEVKERLEKIVSYENDYFLKAQLPRYLPAVEILYGLEIIDDIQQVELTLEKHSGEVVEISIKSCGFKELKGNFMKNLDISEVNLPLYMRNLDRNYWSYYIEEDKILYFNYNSCKDMEDISVEDFCSELMNFINNENVKSLVIDLRNNLGGNSILLEHFIRFLKSCDKLNKENGIFVVLGRETFSSALLNAYSLKNKTKAIFIGEPTGGKPNCYGEVQYFDLKNSKLKIRYSTEYYKIIKDDKVLSLFPDINIQMAFQDYLENRDPCMEYIISQKNNQIENNEY